MFAGFSFCFTAPLPHSLHPSQLETHRKTEAVWKGEKNVGKTKSHKGSARFLHRQLTNRRLCCAACLSPVTRQHCHGDRGLSNHLCNDPYSPEGRRRDGGGGAGGWNESRASKSRGREGGRRRMKRRRRRGGEQQSKAAGTQTGKKTDFLSTGSRERTFYVFI